MFQLRRLLFLSGLVCTTTTWAYDFVGAWGIDSASAVDELEARGFTTFHLLSRFACLDQSTALGQVLDAIDPGHHAIVDLTGSCADNADVYAWVRRIENMPHSDRILGYLTFDEPNLGNTIPVSAQRCRYATVKSAAPWKWVFVDFAITDCGVPNAGTSVDSSGGLSYDSAFVNFYPYRHEWTDAQGEANLASVTLHVSQYFHEATWIWPIQQVAYKDASYCANQLDWAKACYVYEECICGWDVANAAVVPNGVPWCTRDPAEPWYDRQWDYGRYPNLRAQYDLSKQYEIWYSHGLMQNSHALFYYGWSVASEWESKGLSNDPLLLDQAAVMASEHHRRMSP